MRLVVNTAAAVHGACMGGGMELAIACDMVIASDKAVFGQPEVKLGFFPPYAAIRLPQLVGVAKAVEICTTGRRFSALVAPSSFDISLISFATERLLSRSVQRPIRSSRQFVMKRQSLRELKSTGVFTADIAPG